MTSTTEHDYAAQARQAIEIVCSGDVSRMEEFYSPDFVDHVNDMTFHTATREGASRAVPSPQDPHSPAKQHGGVEEQVTEGKPRSLAVDPQRHLPTARAVTLRGITISRLGRRGHQPSKTEDTPIH